MDSEQDELAFLIQQALQWQSKGEKRVKCHQPRLIGSKGPEPQQFRASFQNLVSSMLVSVPQTNLKSRVLESRSEIHIKECQKDSYLIFSPLTFPLILQNTANIVSIFLDIFYRKESAFYCQIFYCM